MASKKRDSLVRDYFNLRSKKELDNPKFENATITQKKSKNPKKKITKNTIIKEFIVD